MSLLTADDTPLPEAARVERLWTNLRARMDEKFPGDVGGKEDPWQLICRRI